VNLLQGVVETASGLGFEEYLRQRVWDPAGRASTRLDVAGRVVPHRARGYEMKGGAPAATGAVDVSYKYASGGMLSTAEDLVRLGIALNDGKLLGPAARAQMWGPQVAIVRRFRPDGPPATEKFQQGYLWRLVKRPSGDFVCHCGTFNGFNACLLDDPRRDLVVAMAYNSEEGGLRPLEQPAAMFRSP
jgi:CubicO group peptidase (beta-lactamase class C family)